MELNPGWALVKKTHTQKNISPTTQKSFTLLLLPVCCYQQPPMTLALVKSCSLVALTGFCFFSLTVSCPLKYVLYMPSSDFSEFSHDIDPRSKFSFLKACLFLKTAVLELCYRKKCWPMYRIHGTPWNYLLSDFLHNIDIWRVERQWEFWG